MSFSIASPCRRKKRVGSATYLYGMIGCPPLSSKQLHNTLQNLRGRYRWRNRCLVVLGTTTGLRVSELLALKIEDVWTGTAPRPRIYVARRHTKGKRQGDSIVMHPRAAAAITKWLGSRRSFAQDDWLFPSQQGQRRPLGRRSAWEVLHDALLQAGVTGMAGTHTMRKTFAANVHRALNGDLFRLAVAMRHTSPLTTLSYLSFRQEEIDRAILRT